MKQDIENLVAEVLDGTELQLKVDSYRLEENLKLGRATVQCDVHHAKTGERRVITGSGVGLVDALFCGLVSMYSDEFPSLKSVEFSDFAVKADFATGRDRARTDSPITVTLQVANSEGKRYAFQDTSPSVARSSINVVLLAAAFFINTERAFMAVYKALHHAREENRDDSIRLYTAQLTTLVGATSYSEVIEQMKAEFEG